MPLSLFPSVLARKRDRNLACQADRTSTEIHHIHFLTSSTASRARYLRGVKQCQSLITLSQTSKTRRLPSCFLPVWEQRKYSSPGGYKQETSTPHPAVSPQRAIAGLWIVMARFEVPQLAKLHQFRGNKQVLALHRRLGAPYLRRTYIQRRSASRVFMMLTGVSSCPPCASLCHPSHCGRPILVRGIRSASEPVQNLTCES